MKRRFFIPLTILAISTVVLFQFQNCAPVRATAPASAAGSPSSDVRLIEDFSKAEIQFAASDVQIHDEVATADVSGLCNRAHNGAKLRWTVWASAGTAVLQGEGSCVAGQFHLAVTNLENLVCGVDHQLIVEGDWGGSAYTHMERRCQPLATEEIALPDGMPAGTECALEYVPASDNLSPCSQVCYRSGQMVSQAPVEASRCSSMAAQLAGP